MKSLKALFLVAVLDVLSCAGIPKPETPQDTLIIGSFVLDFPDGFFDDPSRAITSGIELTITNTTKDSSFSVRDRAKRLLFLSQQRFRLFLFDGFPL